MPLRRKRPSDAATDAQVLEDAERLIAACNERQALRAPMIFSPTIGAAIRAGYWFLCPRLAHAMNSERAVALSSASTIPAPRRRP
jgi:hypothetical protein